MIFYDFEVFEYDWLAVFIDVTNRKEHVIINDKDKLRALYEQNISNIWVGFNNRHYDQYIMKGILLGMDPKKINDWIIVQEKEGWQYSRVFNKLPMINYDVMPNPPVGLKTMEGFMGSNIKETEVPFDIKRKLTEKEIEQTVFYCRHDVEETIKVFLENVDVFNAMHGIVQAFPEYVSLSDIGSSEARITAKVLGCTKQDFNDEFDYFFLPCLRLNKYKYVQDWFSTAVKDCTEEMKMNYAKAKENYEKANSIKLKKKWKSEMEKCDWTDSFRWQKYFYNRSLETVVAGIPHTFGFGGLHGATEKPIHKTGQILHVDVNNYYPSMLIAWGLVTRAAGNDNYPKVYVTRKKMKKAQIQAAKAGDKALAKQWKKAQLPYKKMLNALSGAMKDKTNPAYDPRNNNCMCINGQLMLLDLIEHLEVIPGFELIVSKKPNALFCEAACPVQVIEIAEKQFLQLMEQSHALTRAVLREYERNLWRMGHQLKNTTGNMQMERKIAAKLWKLGRDFGVDTEDGVMIDIDLTITLMADLVGAPRENVSRACKVLTDRGLIRYGNKRFILIDFDGLAKFYKM